MLTLSEVKGEVDRLALVIGAPEDSLPTYGRSEDSGRPHIEVDANGYHFVVRERGLEFERTTARDVDDLLYRIFDSVTLEMALTYVQEHKIEGQDSRRLAFPRQIELYSMLSPEWGDRCSREIERILKEHPFHDLRTSSGQ
jgi:hypothetical protein